jgi:hypothetical protein
MDHDHPLQIATTFLFFVAQQPYLDLGRLTVEVSRSHTVRHTTLYRTSLHEGSARRRNLYLTNTHHSPETDIHAPGGSRTLNPTQWAAEDLRLRPRGDWDRADSRLLIIHNPLPHSVDVIRRQHQLRGRVHIEGLAFIVLIDKCIENYGTVKVSTNGCHWFLSWIRGIHSTL